MMPFDEFLGMAWMAAMAGILIYYFAWQAPRQARIRSERLSELLQQAGLYAAWTTEGDAHFERAGAAMTLHYEPRRRRQRARLFLSTAIAPDLEFMLVRKDGLRKFFEALGTSAKLDSGEPAFDEAFSAVSGAALANELVRETPGRQAVGDIFSCGAQSLTAHDGALAAAWFPSDTLEDVSPEALARCADGLAVLTGRLVAAASRRSGKS